MKIYQAYKEPDKYQYLLPSDPEHSTTRLMFDCEERADGWDPPEMYVANPRAKRGNFFNCIGGDPLICDERAVDEIGDVLEKCAELLPLPVDGETLYVVNVLPCLNLLDVERSVWRGEPGRSTIKAFAFHPTRMQRYPLFKIPETINTSVLTCEGVLDPEFNFKPRVEEAGLTGLLFKILWTDGVNHQE